MSKFELDFEFDLIQKVYLVSFIKDQNIKLYVTCSEGTLHKNVAL